MTRATAATTLPTATRTTKATSKITMKDNKIAQKK